MGIGYEIDFLPVGPESKTGDAITLRFGNLLEGKREEQAVIVIDGGFKDDGQRIVNHVRKYYDGTDTIDLVIATHPHEDHIAGLQTVLTEMQVQEFWMHKPWDESHTNNISRWFVDGRVTDESVSTALKKSLDTARDLEKIADEKGIPIIEPFAGIYKDFGLGRIDIAGPTKEYYESLLPSFAATPEPKGALASLMARGAEMVVEAVSKVFESWDKETLDDTGETSAENNSGAITLLRVADKQLVFTGDAGIPALTNGVDLLEACNITHADCSFIQVPHHGSKRCVGPTLLNRLVGPRLPEEKKSTKKMSAFCSCAVNGAPKHPSKKVTNAFMRRGAPVCPTHVKSIRRYHRAPHRDDYSAMEPLPFYDEVEE
ncbi:MAG: MBL fold metallo-hydrolase [Deltaproteobacteria bacterium]|nr:MBL fold metallo-hydrolase [Deltaproteobacteria bacterium]